MNLLLDAAALIALDRGDRRTAGHIELARRTGATIVTSAPVLGQVWRDGRVQARLARAVQAVDVRSVSAADATRAGELLATDRSSDIVDALLVSVAVPGDRILTGDVEDIERLATSRGMPVAVVRV